MNSIAAKFAAIWCAAEFSGPRRAMNRAMKVKPVTSTKNVSPIGKPSEMMFAMLLQRGQLQRSNTP